MPASIRRRFTFPGIDTLRRIDFLSNARQHRCTNLREGDAPMAYALLIVEPRGQREERTEEEGKASYQCMLDFAASLKAQGLLQAAESLRPDHAGQRVSVRGGQTRIVDGPFAEAREMIGGVFLLNCDSLDQALLIAAQCPAASWATVEVREMAPCYV